MHLSWKNGAVFVVLTLIGAPWYWGLLWPDDRSLLFGMPTWAATAILASFATSCYTAWLLRTPWDSERDSSEGEP